VWLQNQPCGIAFWVSVEWLEQLDNVFSAALPRRNDGSRNIAERRSRVSIEIRTWKSARSVNLFFLLTDY